MFEPGLKRRRSVSSDSVSTISTAASEHPPIQKESAMSQPSRRQREPSADPEGHRDGRHSRRSASRSPSPPRRQQTLSRDSRSPLRESEGQSYRDRDPKQRRDYDEDAMRGRRRQQSSRSPNASARRSERRLEGRDGGRDYRGRGGDFAEGDNDGNRQRRPPEPPRQRSLSPFSKRLALTQSLNRGG